MEESIYKLTGFWNSQGGSPVHNLLWVFASLVVNMIMCLKLMDISKSEMCLRVTYPGLNETHVGKALGVSAPETGEITHITRIVD